MENVRKILCATDFSSSSDMALELASSLAAQSRATMFIVHVDDDAPVLAPGFAVAASADVDQHVAQQEAKLKNTLPTREGVEYRQFYLRGAPADEILTLAKQEGVDLIVMGTHGRTGLSRLLMGSVAEQVVRCANCLVLTAKQPSQSSAEIATD